MNYLGCLAVISIMIFGSSSAQEIPAGDYTLTARCSGYCLSVYHANKHDGGPVCQVYPDNSDAQKWFIAPVMGEPGYYTLTAKSSGYLLSIFCANKIDGGAVCHAVADGSDAQKWFIAPVMGEPGYYTLTAKSSGLCLDVFYANTVDGGLVCQARQNGKNAQKWLIAPVHPDRRGEQKIPQQEQTNPTVSAKSEDENLVWHDEFDGQTLDMTKWSYRHVGNYNKHDHKRCSLKVEKSVCLDGEGHLVITIQNAGEKGLYYEGMIGTNDKFESTFGYYECRVKFHSQPGLVSAFWLQSKNQGRIIGDTRQSGTEVDIFEYIAVKGGRVHHSLHWDGYERHHKKTGRIAEAPGIGPGWHTIGLEWNKDEYIFYVDGQITWQTAQALSHVPQYIILHFVVENWAGDVSQARLPESVYFDYVRVYRERPKGQ